LLGIDLGWSWEEEVSLLERDAKLLRRIGGPDRDRTGDLFHAIAKTITISITYMGYRGLPNT
jgi:hypothetical protein